MVEGITDRYIELYEHITGSPFIRHEDKDILARIEGNINKFLSKE